MQDYSIERAGIANLDFTGDLIGQSAGPIPRVKIYRTKGLKFIGEMKVNQKMSDAQHFDKPADLINWFRSVYGITGEVEDAIEDGRFAFLRLGPGCNSCRTSVRCLDSQEPFELLLSDPLVTNAGHGIEQTTFDEPQNGLVLDLEFCGHFFGRIYFHATLTRFACAVSCQTGHETAHARLMWQVQKNRLAGIKKSAHWKWRIGEETGFIFSWLVLKLFCAVLCSRLISAIYRS